MLATNYGFLSVDINHLINHCLPAARSLGRGRVVWGLYGAGGVNYSPAAAVTLVADVPWPGGGVPASLHSALQTALQSLHGDIYSITSDISLYIEILQVAFLHLGSLDFLLSE